MSIHFAILHAKARMHSLNNPNAACGTINLKRIQYNMDKKFTQLSKYLSYILRHSPESIGITLAKEGWADIDELINNTDQYVLDRKLIDILVETNDKRRFSISQDGKYIKANQGHSIDIDLNLPPQTPPDLLFHGTAKRFLESILKDGLTKQKRHHVHLTESLEVAKSVGSRYGAPVILEIKTTPLLEKEYVFYRTENNVWLIENVPPQAISILS